MTERKTKTENAVLLPSNKFVNVKNNSVDEGEAKRFISAFWLRASVRRDDVNGSLRQQFFLEICSSSSLASGR